VLQIENFKADAIHLPMAKILISPIKPFGEITFLLGRWKVKVVNSETYESISFDKIICNRHAKRKVLVFMHYYAITERELGCKIPW